MSIGNNKKGIVVLTGLILIGLAVKFYLQNFERHVKQRGKVANAYIISVEKYNKPTPAHIVYYYVINADTITYSYFIESRVNFSKLKSLVGRTLSVLYDSTNVKRNMLIINEDQFR